MCTPFVIKICLCICHIGLMCLAAGIGYLGYATYVENVLKSIYGSLMGMGLMCVLVGLLGLLLLWTDHNILTVVYFLSLLVVALVQVVVITLSLYWALKAVLHAVQLYDRMDIIGHEKPYHQHKWDATNLCVAVGIITLLMMLVEVAAAVLLYLLRLDTSYAPRPYYK